MMELLQTLRKIRACAGDAAAQLLLEKYVAQEVEAERERCAKLCEGIDARCPECAAHNDHDQCIVPQPWQYAEAIRSVGR